MLVPAGMVTVMADDPLVGMLDGVALPLRSEPVDGSSRRKTMDSPVMKLVTLPDSVGGNDFTVVDDVNVKVGGPTVTAVLNALSLPTQFPWTGVTE